MREKVKTWIERHCLIRANDQILAACSGGADSVALVHLLCGLQQEYGFTLSVAHVDHGLRGRDSLLDADFVEKLCRQLKLPYYHTRVAVEAFRQENGLSTEEAARILRFRFLRECAKRLGYAKIATGHHFEDQSETVLMRLLRGAGSAGLKGMRPQEGGIIRPLLIVRREEIESYLRGNNLAWRTDNSNFSTEYLRNQIRLELLPYLEERYNPNIKQVLWRVAQIAADEYDYIREQAEAAQAFHIQDDSLVLDREKIKMAPPALRRGIMRAALEKSRGSLKGIRFDHVEMLIHMAVEGRTGMVMPILGGLTARLTYQALVLGRNSETDQTTPVIAPPGIELILPGVTEIPLLDIRVKAELSDDHLPADHDRQAVFDWSAIEPPVFVRTRTNGDRFQPLGMQGSKKLKDFFIDEKVPREKRDKVAIFSDRKGILWIAGYRRSERGKICGHTKRFLRLSIDNREDTRHD